jgi:hypothetical protein
MNSFEMVKNRSGVVYQVTITKEKTFWMKLFGIPTSITYGLRDRGWYNETYDRIASFSEEDNIERNLNALESNPWLT